MQGERRKPSDSRNQRGQRRGTNRLIWCAKPNSSAGSESHFVSEQNTMGIPQNMVSPQHAGFARNNAHEVDVFTLVTRTAHVKCKTQRAYHKTWFHFILTHTALLAEAERIPSRAPKTLREHRAMFRNPPPPPPTPPPPAAVAASSTSRAAGAAAVSDRLLKDRSPQRRTQQLE